MSFEEAMSLLQKVCADFRGTLQEHQLLQRALLVVNPVKANPVEEAEESVEEAQ